MAVLTIQHNTVVNKLKEHLEEVFTAEQIIQLYVDFVPEGFMRPSLQILEIQLPSTVGMITDDHTIIDKTYMFDIQFFPKDTDKPFTEWREIEHILFKNLTEIQLANDYKVGLDYPPNSFMQDKVGHFIIQFTVRCRMIDSSPVTLINGVNFNTSATERK